MRVVRTLFNTTVASMPNGARRRHQLLRYIKFFQHTPCSQCDITLPGAPVLFTRTTRRVSIKWINKSNTS